jgi:hypothetical protein
VTGTSEAPAIGGCCIHARTGMSAERRLALFAYVLVLPVLALILGLVAYPFLFAIWVSFTDRVIGGGGSFIGLDNFRYLEFRDLRRGDSQHRADRAGHRRT